MRQAEGLTEKRRQVWAGGWSSTGWPSRLVWLGRPAVGGAHDAVSTTSPDDTASTMSEYEQAPRLGKAERHNGEKPREAASGRTNGDGAAGGGGGLV
jgi:hypothetical protein